MSEGDRSRVLIYNPTTGEAEEGRLEVATESEASLCYMTTPCLKKVDALLLREHNGIGKPTPGALL